MTDNYYAVIMAGGGGTRLWPLSRRNRPKQALNLVGDRTMFEMAVDRLAPLFPPERILVVTVAEQAEQLRTQRPAIPPQNYLLEPMPRGTASVIGLAAIRLRRRDPGACMVCLTADHHIAAEDRFREVLAAAGDLAEDGHLVTLGITPTYAATGYGYIERGELLGVVGSDRGNGGYRAYAALRFKEKPPLELAETMWSDGRHTWNSGMFAWRVDTILAEIERQMPGLRAALEEIEAAAGTAVEDEVLARVWPQVEVQTIDYGIMEGARGVAVIPTGDIGWTDVGSWETLMSLLEPDEHGNVVVAGECIAVDTTGSLVHASPGGRRRLVALIGLDDLVVVDTRDVLLICPRDRSQEVREVVARLRQRPGGEAYL